MDSSPLHILLIEDDNTDAVVLERLLAERLACFELTHCHRLGDGLHHMGAGDFDVVLLDLTLPDGEGMQLVDRIKAAPATPPVIIMTGRHDEALALRSLQKGIQDYLAKNELSSETLVRSVRYAIERKQTADQLRQVQRMEALGLLAGSVAHDFNNLLTLITGYSNLGLEHLDQSHPVHPFLQEIGKAGERAAALTQQLLAFSRKKVWAPQWLEPAQILEDMRRMLERLIGEDIILDFSSPRETGLIWADQGQIEQIVLNLAINGRDAMPNGGSLRIGLRRTDLAAAERPADSAIAAGPYLQLRVRDSGTGISPEALERIFEPFFTTKEDGKGTGLGLSTVRSIVRDLEGHITVDSVLGDGTTFTILLPLRTADPAETAAEPALAAGKPVLRTVLVVDDEPSILKLTENVLTTAGYTVFTASHPQEAQRLFAEHVGAIEILLTDFIMPEMNGVELAAALHRLDPDLKVLYMSGYPTDVIARHNIDPSTLNLLTKPFKYRDLLEKFQQL